MAEQPPLNREQKRLLQRRGQLTADGQPKAAPRQANPTRPGAPRPSAKQYIGEVRAEMGKVAWPTRAETINYSAVVLITLFVLIGLIFGIDYVWAKGALFLFK